LAMQIKEEKGSRSSSKAPLSGDPKRKESSLWHVVIDVGEGGLVVGTGGEKENKKTVTPRTHNALLDRRTLR